MILKYTMLIVLLDVICWVTTYTLVSENKNSDLTGVLHKSVDNNYEKHINKKKERIKERSTPDVVSPKPSNLHPGNTPHRKENDLKTSNKITAAYVSPYDKPKKNRPLHEIKNNLIKTDTKKVSRLSSSDLESRNNISNKKVGFYEETLEDDLNLPQIHTKISTDTERQHKHEVNDIRPKRKQNENDKKNETIKILKLIDALHRIKTQNKTSEANTTKLDIKKELEKEKISSHDSKTLSNAEKSKKKNINKMPPKPVEYDTIATTNIQINLDPDEMLCFDDDQNEDIVIKNNDYEEVYEKHVPEKEETQSSSDNVSSIDEYAPETTLVKPPYKYPLDINIDELCDINEKDIKLDTDLNEVDTDIADSNEVNPTVTVERNEINPNNTDRIWKTWKNTEIHIKSKEPVDVTYIPGGTKPLQIDYNYNNRIKPFYLTRSSYENYCWPLTYNPYYFVYKK